MAKSFVGLKSFGSKAVSVIASGALALSLTPAIALATPGTAAGAGDLQAQGANLSVQSEESQVITSAYQNTIAGGTKNIIGNNGDALGGKVQVVESGTDANKHTYQYMGYAHSDDGGHYQAYSLYTKLKTDDKGILTAIDLTSGNDTFAGKWGFQQAKSAAPVEGFLPVGVDFKVAKGADGKYTAKLTGADEMGYLINQVTYLSVSKNGEAYSTVASKDAISTYKNNPNDRQEKTKYKWDENLAIGNATSGTDDGSTLTGDLVITIPELEQGTCNLVKCTYVIGSEQTAFNVYFYVGDGAEEIAREYVESQVKPTTWVEDPVQPMDTGGRGGSSGSSVNYTTNRDGWTAIMGTVMLRELASWGAAMADPSLSTDLDGELGDIDTVSGATKTSVPFVNALVEARNAGYIKGVSEDLAFTIDGEHAADAKSLPRLTISSVEGTQDRTTVTTGEDGLYTANVVIKPNGGGRLSLDAVYLYDLSGKKVGTQGMMILAKQSTPEEDSESDAEEGPYTALKTFKESSPYIPYSIALDAYQSDDYDGGDRVKTSNVSSLTNDDIDFQYKSAGDTIVKVKNTNATHLVMEYTVGHGTIALAYDLENMSKVPDVTNALTAADADKPETVTAARAAYDATPYDVRPFTSGIANLHKQEANLASQSIKDADVSSENGYASAKESYDALDAAAKAQLTDDAKAAITAAIDKHTIASVSATPTSSEYTGSDIKPAVTVKAADGSVINAANFDTTYASNINAGTATVTVKGKGAYEGTATATFQIAKTANAITATASNPKAVTFNAKAQTIANPLSVTGAQGAVTYSKASGDSRFTVNPTTGAITVAKSTPASTYQVGIAATAAGDANHGAGSVTKTVSITVSKASQTIKPAKTYTVKLSKVKKKAQKVAVKFSANGGGKVTYAAAKTAGGKVSIAKNGKVTVKKGTKKGTYTLNVKVTAAAKGSYAKTTKSVSLKVKVK